MPCMRCGSEYGIFKKEGYCRNCGFSYCSACLSKKIVVPKLGTDCKRTVCSSCYTLLSSGQTELPTDKKRRSPSPPAALQKRIDQMNAAVSGTTAPHRAGKSLNANNGDADLASRLYGLRADRMNGIVPSLSELEERLAKLKGVQADLEQRKRSYDGPVFSVSRPVDAGQKMQTPMEQAQHLFQQATDEVVLDVAAGRSMDPDEEIRRRLERLRSHDESLNDLNKKPAANGFASGEPNGVGGSSALSTTTTTLPINDIPSTASDAHHLEVWQCILEAEREACREAEEALRLQEKDKELKVKLDEIRANRDVALAAKRLPTAASKLYTTTADCYSDEDNEDKLADKVVQQFLNEARLEADSEMASAVLRTNGKRRAERKLINSSENEPNESKELPWCAICNNDAILRCYGCEGDLYCRRCYKECHDSDELRKHSCGAYQQRSEMNSDD